MAKVRPIKYGLPRNTRFTEADDARLVAQAEHAQVPVSQIVREAVRKHLARTSKVLEEARP